MPITVVCPHCSVKIRAPDLIVSRNVRCPNCAQDVFLSRLAEDITEYQRIDALPLPVPSGVVCVHCHRAIGPDPRYAGQRVLRPHCRREIYMPDAQLPAPLPLPRTRNPPKLQVEKQEQSFLTQKKLQFVASGSPVALGVSSLFLGLISLLFIPFCAGVFAGLLSILGMISGLVGVLISLSQKNRAIGVPSAGLGLNVLVLLLFVVFLLIRFSPPPANNNANPVFVKQTGQNEELLKQKQIAEGDELLAVRKKEEAIAKYKAGFSAAGNRQAELIRMIVDFELNRNHVGEARTWIQRGLDLNLQIDYANEDSRKFLAKIKKERGG